MPVGQVTIQTVSYLGELFQTSKRPNTLLKLLGGMQGGIQETRAKEFPIGVYYGLRTPSQPANLEGAVAPAAQYRAFTQSTNVVQIFHEAISLSYLAQSDQTVAGIIPLPMGKAQGEVQNPRSEAFQVMSALETIAQDMNYSMLNGTFANPANAAATALQMRGLLSAIVTNSIDHSADVAANVTPASYKTYVESAMQLLIQSTGFNPDNTWTVLAGVSEFNNIQAAYESKTTPPYDREIAGLKLRQLYTRFGILNLALEPDMPAQFFCIANLGMAGIVGLPVPNKGVLFEEPLFKQGSADQTQIYGQMGIDHGPEYMHCKVKVPAGVGL